ncbi:MAG: hypothetical protein IT530_21705 [Burkholderiales bacterium]|nr:hypothetical protein [Burkholderiales bacterium]
MSGKTVALISNNNPSMAKIHARIAQRLQSEFGVSVIRSYQVPRNFAPPAGSLEQIARECDAAVFGLAN